MVLPFSPKVGLGNNYLMLKANLFSPISLSTPVNLTVTGLGAPIAITAAREGG